MTKEPTQLFSEIFTIFSTVQCTFSIPWCVWQYSTEITRSICNFQLCLTPCKHLKQSLNSFPRYWQFVLWEHFGHAKTYLTTPNKTQTSRSFHQSLTLCEELRQSLDSFLKYRWFSISGDLLPGHAWPNLTKMR